MSIDPYASCIHFELDLADYKGALQLITDDAHLEVRLARSEGDIVSVQRLRYQVFVQEMGATGDHIDHRNGLETDQFDPFCEHLLLVDRRLEDKSPDYVVGSYRMLDRMAADRAGGFYSQNEFDLSVLLDGPERILELGRSCVHRSYRTGLALYRLWKGLATYVERHEYAILFGVASFHGADPDDHVEALHYLQENHLAPPGMRVVARGMQDHRTVTNFKRTVAMTQMPPLIKAYLRIGGYVGQGFFVDRAFNTTDVCMVLDARESGSGQRLRHYNGQSVP